jgi:DNA-binding protein
MTSSETPQSKPEIPPISRRRQQRIREIQDLFDSGLKVSEISELYGISERTVRQDKEDGKALDRALSKAVDQAEVLGREIRSYEQALRMEWRAYRTATNPFVKVACMRNIIALKEKYIKFLQGAGLIEKVADQLKIIDIPYGEKPVREAVLDLVKLINEAVAKDSEPKE